MRGPPVQQILTVGFRAGFQGADAGADQPERGSVDLAAEHFAHRRKYSRGKLGRDLKRLRAGALPEIRGLQFQRDGGAREVAALEA